MDGLCFHVNSYHPEKHTVSPNKLNSHGCIAIFQNSMIQEEKWEASGAEGLRNMANTSFLLFQNVFSVHILVPPIEIRMPYHQWWASVPGSIFFLMEHKILVWLIIEEVLDLMKYIKWPPWTRADIATEYSGVLTGGLWRALRALPWDRKARV